MNTQETERELPWKLRPFPELVRLSWPIAVSMLSYSVMTLVDTLFAGRLGAITVGAVGFGGAIAFSLLSFSIGLLRSAKVLASQAVGAGRRDRVPGITGGALVLALTVGLATAIAGQLIALSLHLVAEESRSVRLAERYVALRLLGAPIVLVGFAIRELRCALGDTRAQMRASLVANALHVPVNYLLVFTAGLGVTGAALSTVLAQLLETSLLLAVQREDGLGLRDFTRSDLGELWTLGWPLGVERFLNVASFSTLVTLVARASDTDLAAHQVAHQLVLFALLPMMAIAEASAVLAGQAVGANEDALVRKVARVAIGTGAAYGALCALVFVIAGPLVTPALTGDARVQALSARLLLIGAAWQAFDSVYLVGGAVLRGVGDVRFATTAMVTIAWVVTPPLAAFLGLTLHLGALGGWLAVLAEWATGALVIGLRVAGGGWLRAAKSSRERLRDRAVLIPEPAQ